MIYRIIIIFLILFNSLSLYSQVAVDWVARYNGGFGQDAGLAITVDDSGYVYVTGTSHGNQTRQDLVILKYSSTGINKWIRRFADTVNSSFNAGFDIAVDKFYNSYVGGSGAFKYDPNGILTWSNITGSYYAIVLDDTGNFYGTGGSSSFLTRKFSTNGILLWEKTYQNLDYNVARDITLDKIGNVIITGISSQTGSLYDFMTIKYSNNGNVIWQRRYNGGGDDYAYAIASDDSNNVYVTGWNSNSTVDILTIKYSADGDTVWKAVYDGGGSDVGYDVEVDTLGNVYVAGWTNFNDYVTLKYDINGNLLWSRIQASELFPYAPKLKLDRDRNVYMSYITFRPGLNSNYAVVKYNNEGVQQWIVEYNNNGGADINYIYDLAIDKQANVYVTGQSGSSIATVKFVQDPTSINNSSSNIPESILLYQNYPNPFNPSTVINYYIPSNVKRQTSDVKLIIYNTLGKEIATLVNQKQDAGIYSITFDGSDLPSGIYFYKLFINGNSIETKRMVLLK